MSTPTVIESPLRLEPVTRDSFVADLDTTPTEAQLELIVAASSRRRIFD